MKKLLVGLLGLSIALPIACLAQSAAGALAFPPSRPNSGPVLDYVRRVLTCDSLACTFKVVRSQQELMRAMEFTPAQETQVISTRQSTDGGKTWTTSNMTVPVYRVPLRLLMGGCFGADLPFSVSTDGGDLRVPRAVAAETENLRR
jgi:hypothetical protein